MYNRGQFPRRGETGLALLMSLALCGGSSAALAESDPTTLPETQVTASRLGEGVTGASTTVITAEEIERSPGQSLPEILQRVPGVQVQTMFGGVNGSNAMIDLRGFGATATNNTLILVNGRRLNDVDLASVDLSAIQRSNIERIEITRGNAGAVLYGDGAVGGVINIITKNAVNTPDVARVEGAIGSLGYRETSATVSRRIGDTALSMAGSQITSDGYRDNNNLKQRTVSGEVRQHLDSGELYFNFGADDQHLGLPGAVSLANFDQGARAGTTTPYDHAEKRGLNTALGGSFDLAPGLELVVDGGIRHKEQEDAFFSAWGAVWDTYNERRLTTLSVTPRLNGEGKIAGLPNRVTTGVDYVYSLYDSRRMWHQDDNPFHTYHLRQHTISEYVQDTLSVRPDTDLSFGARIEHLLLSAVDRYNPDAVPTGGSVSPGGESLSSSDTQYALHLGLDHRLTEQLTVFGRIGRSLRLPTVDERIGATAWGAGTNFALKAQTSRDLEIGLRGRHGDLGWQTSAYVMDLTDELHYDPIRGVNLNLDPTRRYGAESSVTYRLTPTVRLKGGLAYTEAKFLEGANKDKDVPLVSRWTGSAGVSWDAWERYVVVDLDARYVGDRRADNDQANFQPLIDDYTLVDLRIGGELNPVFWSFTVQNLFDETYYDYAIASTTTYGAANVYTLPGRTMIGRLGLSF